MAEKTSPAKPNSSDEYGHLNFDHASISDIEEDSVDMYMDQQNRRFKIIDDMTFEFEEI
jgi:hypothetical protein